MVKEFFPEFWLIKPEKDYGTWFKYNEERVIALLLAYELTF